MTQFTTNYFYDLPEELKRHIMSFIPTHNRILTDRFDKKRDDFVKQFGKMTESSEGSIPRKYWPPFFGLYKRPHHTANLRMVNFRKYDHYKVYRCSSGWLIVNSPYVHGNTHQELIDEGWTETERFYNHENTRSYYYFVKKQIN